MNIVRIALFSSLVAGLGGLYWLQQSAVELTADQDFKKAVVSPVILQPLEEIVLSAKPLVQPLEIVQESEEPVAVKTPVQPLEERGDMMLFEIEALAGMPFGQAILMPFD